MTLDDAAMSDPVIRGGQCSQALIVLWDPATLARAHCLTVAAAANNVNRTPITPT